MVVRNLHNIFQCIYFKKSACEWTHVVQGSAVFGCLVRTVSLGAWFSTLAAKSPGGLLEVLAPNSMRSESLGMGHSHHHLLKLSRIESYILGKLHSKGRETMSGIIKKIPPRRAKDVFGTEEGDRLECEEKPGQRQRQRAGTEAGGSSVEMHAG